MTDRDIVDAIDELVDWQMSQYENRSGYDRNVNQVTCPHVWCDADWHGLAITRRMQQMRRRGLVDPEYVYADDDSEVLCPGSDFDGEFTPPATPSGYDAGGWIAPELEFPRNYYDGFLRPRNPVAPWVIWPLPDDPFDDNSSRGVIEMTEVDSLRGLRCQVDTPDAAYAECLREHVRCSFFEEVAHRYSGVRLDSAEIRTEYRQDGISRLVAWWEPDPVGGILEGGHAHGREVGPNVGHRVETITPVIPTLTDFNNPPMSIDLPTVTYERAAYDTVTRRWVYRPRQPAPRATARPQAARQHLILAGSHRTATIYARHQSFDSRPLIITRREHCRGLDPSRYVIHYLGNPDLLDEIRMRLHNGVTLESLMYTPGDQAA
ncbi:hypothetical protein [Nocardia rhizosphaerae]|uniref:Uncharacterized protein n=1 Tax=Nocardia rhizosphaerae TaxID=1691571 RepID=A0ABV8LDI7_9NOCA